MNHCADTYIYPSVGISWKAVESSVEMVLLTSDLKGRLRIWCCHVTPHDSAPSTIEGSLRKRTCSSQTADEEKKAH